MTKTLADMTADERKECECLYLPEKYHYVYYGITEPGSMQEYNPHCPVHGEHHERNQK